MAIVLGLAAGLILVILGAELLVRGAARAAAALGVSPLLIGLTVVAYGTSAPEFAVSVSAGLTGRPALAVANVVGSNVFNVLAIVGLAALLSPIAAAARVVRREVPIMLAATVGTMLLAADGALTRGDGAVLLAGLVAVTLSQFRGARSPHPAAARAGPTARGLLGDAGLVLAGLAALVVGSRWLVDAAAAGAAALGVSELVVGLTIVAAGTSVPELATSLVAAARGERDLAIGNVVGSNVFNLLGVLGVSALAAPTGLAIADQVRSLDAWVALGAAAVLLPMAWSGAAIVRWEGAVLFAGYVAYLAAVVAIAVGALGLPSPGTGAAVATLPLAVVLLAAAGGRRRPRPPAGRGAP